MKTFTKKLTDVFFFFLRATLFIIILMYFTLLYSLLKDLYHTTKQLPILTKKTKYIYFDYC